MQQMIADEKMQDEHRFATRDICDHLFLLMCATSVKMLLNFPMEKVEVRFKKTKIISRPEFSFEQGSR